MPAAERAAAGVQRVAAGRYRLEGTLDFATVPGLWLELEPLIAGGHDLRFSLEGVRRANSAGLALLLQALEVAHERNIDLWFDDLPGELRDLANLSGAAALLG